MTALKKLNDYEQHEDFSRYTVESVYELDGKYVLIDINGLSFANGTFMSRGYLSSRTNTIIMTIIMSRSWVPMSCIHNHGAWFLRVIMSNSHILCLFCRLNFSVLPQEKMVQNIAIQRQSYFLLHQQQAVTKKKKKKIVFIFSSVKIKLVIILIVVPFLIH